MEIDSGAHKKAEALGLPSDWRITADMAEYYVLERLAHDDANRYGARFAKHVATLAPRLARYNVAICGGELRHMPGYGGDGYDDCYEEHGGECGCHCEDCHCESFHEHDYDCYENDCECEEACDCEPDLTCDMAEEECENGYEEFWENECNCSVDNDWEDYVNRADLMDAIGEAAGGGRSSGWQTFIDAWDACDDEQNRAKFVAAMADAFDEEFWGDGGYGGPNWQNVAQLTADYLKGKVKASTFVDRCWSLEHNGGNIFNKLFTYDACNVLMNLLIEQAEDNYTRLVGACRFDVAKLWHNRNMFLRAEFDDAWIGRETIFYDEDEEVA